MSTHADLSDAGLADLIDTVRTEIVRRNDLLRDNASPSARSLVNCRQYALLALTQADERLRAGAATDLPAADLPAIDEPRVPRRPPLGGDPTRPRNGNGLPPGRPHP
ncbi:hypothetical protein [Methylorubrum extorquens]|uniref:hypothetical protein n=1 Tax=Methylorubrum extorquens TaxID=408 RepID=UPI000158F991|nr:hypothetical protein [Methylorubrum extorquens]ABY30839.1 hypothetical protein Mext_2444 [Methylorubrum extorquens PA1]KQP87565.1 hypothetical protein ASF55_06995 [Methylobacterium sp. Leaf119]WIU37498.1 hypothetical protein KQ926_12730 [Methylorubrum extorquens]